MAVSISVPQQDGEIRIALNGDGAHSYPVDKGVVSVEEVDATVFLLHVPGSAIVPAKATAKAADTAKAS